MHSSRAIPCSRTSSNTGEAFVTVQEVKNSVSRDKETKEPVTLSKESDICFVCTKDERNFADLVKTITGFILA